MCMVSCVVRTAQQRRCTGAGGCGCTTALALATARHAPIADRCSLPLLAYRNKAMGGAIIVHIYVCVAFGLWALLWVHVHAADGKPPRRGAHDHSTLDHEC